MQFKLMRYRSVDYGMTGMTVRDRFDLSVFCGLSGSFWDNLTTQAEQFGYQAACGPT